MLILLKKSLTFSYVVICHCLIFSIVLPIQQYFFFPLSFDNFSRLFCKRLEQLALRGWRCQVCMYLFRSYLQRLINVAKLQLFADIARQKQIILLQRQHSSRLVCSSMKGVRQFGIRESNFQSFRL